MSRIWKGAISRFKTDRNVANNCEVVFFETRPRPSVDGQDQAIYRMGFVHNRRFGDTPQNQVIRHIRDMVFAAWV
jgi:hypothetical protein